MKGQLYILLLGLMLAGLPLKNSAASVSLQVDDALNTTSFTGSTNWSNHLTPVRTNDYANAAHTLRTPTGANIVSIFGGGSLTITGTGSQTVATTDALLFKGSGASGLLTISNLTINGGEFRNASGTADSFNLAGNILTVGNSGMVVHMQGPIVVNSPVAGAGNISIIAGTASSACTLHFASASNTFTGNISLASSTASRFALDAGANLNFVLGAAGVNNSVTGSGAVNYDGRFKFDFTAASTNTGDAWTLSSVASQVFDSTFSVDGFARIGGGTGSGVWQAATNGANYSFDTSIGVLSVVAQLASTNTPLMFTNSRVAFLRDVVTASNACLMANTGSYGRAINGVSFQKDNILLTFGGYQYTAWYDNTNSTQNVWLARRTVTNTSVGAWEKFNTGSTFVNGKASWDAHCVISIGICPADGTLHMAWDHHDNTLRYRRSVAGLCTTNKAAWGAGAMNAEQNWLVNSSTTELDVTYPQFTITQGGGLIFNRRMGVSGNGDQYFQIYNPATGAWNAKIQFINRAGTYVGVDPFGTTRTCTERCAYINGFDMDTNGTIHVTWTWRESASQYGNRDICYAYSPDLGTSWYNSAGTKIADTSLGQTITQASTGITIVPLDMRQLLINQQAQCVDNAGRVHVLMLQRRQETGYDPSVYSAEFSTKFTAYYHYFRDPATGAWTQRRIPPDLYPPGSRPKIGFDAAGNLYAAFVSYPAGTAVTPGYTSGQLVIAAASAATSYTNWDIVQVIPTQFDGEPMIDQARLLADNILAAYLQEHSTNTAAVGTPLHAFEFAVSTTPTIPLALDFSAADSLVTFSAAAGHNYKLQSASTLSPTNWTNASAIVPGISGRMTLNDVNGKNSGQRFYRVVTDP